MKIKKYKNIKVFNINKIPKSFISIFEDEYLECNNKYIEFDFSHWDIVSNIEKYNLGLKAEKWFIKNGAKRNETVLVYSLQKGYIE